MGKVEYLYRPGSRDTEPCVERLRIVKRTPKRIYYIDAGVTRFVDRYDLETTGKVEPRDWRLRHPWTDRSLDIYLTARTCLVRARAIAWSPIVARRSRRARRNCEGQACQAQTGDGRRPSRSRRHCRTVHQSP